MPAAALLPLACRALQVATAACRQMVSLRGFLSLSMPASSTRRYNFASVAISSLSERSGLSVTGQVATPADIP